MGLGCNCSIKKANTLLKAEDSILTKYFLVQSFNTTFPQEILMSGLWPSPFQYFYPVW